MQTSKYTRERKRAGRKCVKIIIIFKNNQKTSFSLEMLKCLKLLSNVMEENQSPVQKTYHNTVYQHAGKQRMGQTERTSLSKVTTAHQTHQYDLTTL